MTELQAMYLIGAGHGLVNIVARVLAFDPHLRNQLARKKQLGTDFPPFSEETQDWIPLSPRKVGVLQMVAASQPAAIALLDPLASLVSDKRWEALVELRGKDFHRWRPQTAGMAGVPQHSPWRKQDNGSWVMSVPARRTSDDSDRLAAERGDVANSAMSILAAAMDTVGDRLGAASTALGGPRFKA
jgi:hypothetical protein